MGKSKHGQIKIMFLGKGFTLDEAVEPSEQLSEGAEKDKAPSPGKTLVIHPEDPTTDSLTRVYAGIEAEVIRNTSDQCALYGKMLEADRVICLGHGLPIGLIGSDRRICVDHRHVELLRTKRDCIFVWCHATDFLQEHGLSGFATGMFISEPYEAQMYDVFYISNMIEASTIRFADAVNQSIKAGHGLEEMACYVLDGYSGDWPVVMFNRPRLASIRDGKKTMSEAISEAMKESE